VCFNTHGTAYASSSSIDGVFENGLESQIGKHPYKSSIDPPLNSLDVVSYCLCSGFAVVEVLLVFVT